MKHCPFRHVVKLQSSAAHVLCCWRVTIGDAGHLAMAKTSSDNMFTGDCACTQPGYHRAGTDLSNSRSWLPSTCSSGAWEYTVTRNVVYLFGLNVDTNLEDPRVSANTLTTHALYAQRVREALGPNIAFHGDRR